MGDFQTQVYSTLAPGVLGDFASHNPRAVVLAGPGGLIAGPGGVSVGTFVWLDDTYVDADNTALRVNNYGSGSVAGFVHREQQALITTYLAAYGLLIPQGFGVTVFSAGDFWAYNSGSGQATVGMKAYANLTTGKITFAATGSASTASGSSSSVAAETNSFTGSISGNVLTVTGSVTGTIYPGTTISGSGVASGTQIVSQISGTTNGAGTYAVSIPEQTVASTSISGTYGLLTVGGTVSGTFAVGGLLSGSGVASGTYITALGTGTGGAGTYVVNNNTVVSSTSISSTTNVETKWIAQSSGASGELVKISSYALG